MRRTNGSESVKDSIENELIFNQGVGRRKRGGRKSVSLSAETNHITCFHFADIGRPL